MEGKITCSTFVLYKAFVLYKEWLVFKSDSTKRTPLTSKLFVLSEIQARRKTYVHLAWNDIVNCLENFESAIANAVVSET